ncbi:hypothetical protein [Kitasatospora brasiliensis]|uniref:hypothetical protein n=1 Tax=Kitasatospora brasiliensis TaxID=3058040 RepID=UPI00292DF068|nr:hypothetical protein [Kitasatospora sp. K002]
MDAFDKEGLLMALAVTAPSVPGLVPGGRVEQRTWLVGAGSPYLISDFLALHRWSWVTDLRGSIHASSRC